MTINSKLRRRYTPDEVALIAISHDVNWKAFSLFTHRIDEADIHCVQRTQTIAIKKALHDEILIAQQNRSEKNGSGLSTVIKCFGNSDEIRLERCSVAKWFHIKNRPDIAKSLDENESYLSHEICDERDKKEYVDDFERESRSYLITLADIISEECWEDLPDDMNKPTIKQLTAFIKTKGLLEKKLLLS